MEKHAGLSPEGLGLAVVSVWVTDGQTGRTPGNRAGRGVVPTSCLALPSLAVSAVCRLTCGVGGADAGELQVALQVSQTAGICSTKLTD